MEPTLPHLQLTRPLAVIDIETTGLAPSAARVVEVAAVKLVPAGPPELFRARVDPGCPIPPAATLVHGITDADVRGLPPFGAVACPLAAFLRGSDFAGFNLANYDLPVLAREFAAAGVPFPLSGRAVVDVLALFHRQERRDLTAAVKFYLGREHLAAHAAVADAWATAEVLNAQLARYPALPADPAGLHKVLVEVDVGRRFRRGPAGEVVMGFGKYAGVPLAAVAQGDPGYLRWLTTTDLLDDARRLVRRALGGLPPEPLAPATA